MKLLEASLHYLIFIIHYFFCYKQDLIDKAQTTLVGNYNLIQKINASLGESANGDADDDALADFNQVGARFSS